MKSLKKLLPLLSLGLVLAAQATPLRLMCFRETEGPSEYRTVIVGDEKKAVSLWATHEKKEKLSLKKFAIEIELIGGEVAREEWEVLSPKEFSLVEREDSSEAQPAWDYTNKLTKKTYYCNIESEVHANPAITRSN